ncbi:hypothetical protein DOK67_0001599 [Enterococcus sp. DIV0212c]|uniref:type 2 lanthipeptide synthetase LanM family protein n=1 Tax=Enterococcus sp. DIV0212c TaxID=2230867 RepID=UPI001A9BA25D|nr:type 2 lanthipeptide synthetase LanM family protein [Enterococcus sp. DIV0212c]MBO1354195.1 type 2 lantipeptide synthetase LanM family protein [Enterococcus sp. DIV0212c]
MNLKNLAKATSIRQRHALLKEYYSKNQMTYSGDHLENYTSWRKRPTTVTDERFKEILQSMQLTEEDFDFAIKKLTSDEKEYIYAAISDDEWVKTTQKVLEQEDYFSGDILDEKKVSFTYVLRLHIDYFKKQLKQILTKYPTIQVRETAINDFVEEIINRFMEIGLRTLVYDLHVEKETMHFSESMNEKEEFQQYLVNRFDTKQKLAVFFTQYPVVTRLYAEIIHFQLANFEALIQAITESETELSQLFKIDTPISLTNIKMGAGDSHDRGKSVAILTFNNKVDLVFKPKNLIISERFDRFVREINKIDDSFDFYLTTKIVKENYTFEERLIHTSCQSEEEVIQYYRQFGQTIGLVYLLNGNDFHLENVMAIGKNPVLIDLETIIQNHLPMQDSQNAITKIMQENGESVVMSGLVPIYLFEERTGVNGATQGIQLSALNGGEQKLPYKVLKVVNFDSVNMQFMYQEHITDAAENIPLLNGEKVDFVPYIETIFAGFKEFSAFALKNKQALVTLAENIFSDCLVRNVIKPTQSYGDLLDYSSHPTCMVDYIEREKLFENLWMHDYSNSKPVPYEVRDMLQHDVPIFFNRTSSRNLIASQGEVIPEMYQEKAIDLEMARLKNFSKEQEEQQVDYLKTSFGLYHATDLQEKTIPLKQVETFLNGSIAVGEAILEAAFLGKDSIAWKNIEETAPDHYVVHVMNENFYDGITGMYLYFSELYHVTGDTQFKKAYELAEALVLKLQTDYLDSVSAFYGSVAAIYPLLYTYQYNGKTNLLQAAESIAKRYMTRYDRNAIENYDWTSGTASIVKVFVHLYQVTSNDIYFEFAKQLISDLDHTKIIQGGFAHGYSGVIYAINSVLKVESDPELTLLIKKYLAKERLTFDTEQEGWLDLRPVPPMVNDLWCYGSTGIGIAYLDLINSDFEDQRLTEEVQIAAKRLLKQEKRDDCLCHGYFGDLEFLIEYGKTSIATEQQKEEIQARIKKANQKIVDKKYTFEGLPTIPKYGLFTGLAGIGHQLLRIHDANLVADILTLELPKK